MRTSAVSPAEEGEATAPSVQLDDFYARARALLPNDVFDYIDGWADNGITHRANRSDFDRLSLLPLVMRDVSRVDVSTTYLGRKSSLPIGLSPTAFHQLAHPQGELASAQAAQAKDAPMIVSAMASRTLEEIAEHCVGSRLWLHVYLFRDRTVTRNLIARAEAEPAVLEEVVVRVDVHLRGLAVAVALLDQVHACVVRHRSGHAERVLVAAQAVGAVPLVLAVAVAACPQIRGCVRGAGVRGAGGGRAA